jgi:hypothetical protein
MGRYSDYNEVREKDHWDTIDPRATPTSVQRYDKG